MSYELGQKIALFEESSLLDNIFTKFNSSLFIIGSHSKKRPNNIVFGCKFDNHILDMYKFEISDYTPMKGNSLDKFNIGSKPMLGFTGFPNDGGNMPKFYLKTLFIDMFRGPKVKNINRYGIDQCIYFQSINNEKFLLTFCKVSTKMENERRVVSDVGEVGATCALTLTRQQSPEPNLWKKSPKKPISTKPKKLKNTEKDVLGNIYGRVHLERENNDKLAELASDKYHRRLRKSNKVEKMELVSLSKPAQGSMISVKVITFINEGSASYLDADNR